MNNSTKPNVDLSNNSIKSYNYEEYKNLLSYIENFCISHSINYKFVSENLIIYPADYNEINNSRYDLSKVYVQLISWTESINNAIEDYEITSMYWTDINKNINSIEDLEKYLLEIHHSKQPKEAYFTETEKSELLKKRKKAAKKIVKEEEKRKTKFSKKCKKYNISDKVFLELLEAYKLSNNKYMWN